MQSREFTYRFLLPSILALSLFAIYFGTLAPGLTWANNGADGGDLIAAAATGGVPHPTGYPLYILLARAFQLLPIGSLAFRTNLLSAITTVLTAVLLYSLMMRVITFHNWSVALVCGFAFGLSPLIWSQAVITEVYALQSFLLVLLLFVFVCRVSCEIHSDIFQGLILGLAIANHVTAIFFAPVVLLGGTLLRTQFESREKWEINWMCILRRTMSMAVALLFYLFLPIRARSAPPVNWGNPVTLARFWWLISGRLYQENFLHLSLGEIGLRIKDWAFLLLQQVGPLGLIIALIGLVYFFKPSRLYVFTLWSVIGYSVFSIGYGFSDSYVYLIPAYISFVIWLGIGLDGLMGQWLKHVYRDVICVGMLVYLFVLATFNWPKVDASHDFRAEAFGREVFASAPSRAILFARGDRAVFALWYFHFALRERPDVMVIASDLLHFDWYQETLRSTYPSLIIHGPFPWPETVINDNPYLPVCYVEYDGQTVMNCRNVTSK